ncbi:MAG: choice-of-anchor D domain-containing protein [Phycisphaerae bacterium]
MRSLARFVARTSGLRLSACITLGFVAVFTETAAGQLRVAEWNVTNYTNGRVAEFQTAIYGVFEGRSMAPDIVIGQEFINQTGLTIFLSILNTAPGSPADWAVAPFVNGPDTDNAFFYRTSKVDFLGVTTVAVGGFSPNHPRNIERYDVRLKNYTSDGAVLACYSSHMKAGSSGTDQSRRLLEAQRIRDDAESLNADWQFLLGGDFNIQTSSQAAYIEMIGPQANNDGRFTDPIRRAGSWNNNSSFEVIHTQDPAGAGGMDDRHDQILVEFSLVDGVGFDYIGNPIAYDLSTWDDPNHSYRSWGNDGTSYNTTLTVTGNDMVGATIAQALIDSALTGGHLPVFLDLRVPAKISSDAVIDFGMVGQGDLAQQTLTVTNNGDTALWTAAGIADLVYSMSTTAGFTAPGGSFAEPAGGGSDMHVIEMDTSTAGVKNGTLTILSDAPDQPSLVVSVTGEVVPSCDPFDANCDMVVDTNDVTPFANLLLGLSSPCDSCTGDGSGNAIVDADDIQSFVDRLINGP